MRWAIAAVLGIHALVHLLGFVKAFDLAKVPQLTKAISAPWGVLWLAAAVLMLGTAASMISWPRGYWILGLAALFASQIAIVSSWTDAKFGTLANVILLAVVAHGALTQGPWSFRAAYDEAAANGHARLASTAPTGAITDAEVAALPAPVARYLRATGAVGQPRVTSYQPHFRGRIRGGPTDRWMSFVADQQSFTDPPTRLFLMDASMSGVPVQAFHRFANEAATMQVKVLGVVTVVDAAGAVMNRSETVTLFNDMCILAPASLLSPSIAWEAIDDRTTRARFTHGPQTISASLHFDADGMLANFVSDDRSRASRDGRTFTLQRFSTPVSEYRQYGPVRLASRGEARWHAPEPEGEFVYGEFELLDISHAAS